MSIPFDMLLALFALVKQIEDAFDAEDYAKAIALLAEAYELYKELDL